tara:strand:+ start:210 stop:806 length:597 start_codon:yes stop_codon:yes gene_type:complete
MLDRYSYRLIEPFLTTVGRNLLKVGLTPNSLTWIGLAFCIFAVVSIFYSNMLWGLLFIYLNRLCDGLDGHMARQTQITNYGGFIDIFFDFIFYALIPLSFGFQREENLIPAIILLLATFLNGTSFLAFAAAKSTEGKNKEFQKKSIYYSYGLMEGTETILFFSLFCIIPDNFSFISYIFSALIFVTMLQRVYEAKKIL